MQVFQSIHLFVLIWVGVAVLWSLRLAYRRRGAAADDSIRLILTTSGWLLILTGVLGSVMQALIADVTSPTSWIALVLGWAVILSVAIMAVSRYRGSENWTLLWCLAAAAERGIPLEQAARAYSLERSDELGIRAARLADLLEGGTPLSLALAATRVRLPLDTLLALRVGIETGDLGAALARIAKYDDDTDTLLRAVFEKVFYLGVVANVLLVVQTFLMLKIVPVYVKMFEEFDLRLPPMTQALVAMSDFFVGYWFLFAPILIWLPMFLVVGMLYYVGWLPRSLPLINWFMLRLDGGLVMRCLALAVHQQRPLPEMISLLGRLYPKSSVRKRLLRALLDVNGGEHWCRALQRTKLLRVSDVAILTSAERSGNLEWALEEMADSSIRRLIYRLRLALSVLFPSVLFIFGMFIAFLVISMFIPLVSLITGVA